MNWTQAKMLLLADVVEYSLANTEMSKNFCIKSNIKNIKHAIKSPETNGKHINYD